MKLPISSDARIAILGFGIEGRSTYACLAQQGFSSSSLTILDQNTELQLPAGCNSVLGDDYMNTSETYDYIFVSPGITKKKRHGTRLDQNHGNEIFVSQTSVFLKYFPGKVIGVTGSKGKSTTSSFIAQLLETAGKDVALCGNIGKPALEVLTQKHLPEIVVYEISSYMLESLGEFSLYIGIFTSLHQAHIDSHGSAEAYVNAKWKLVTHAKHVLLSEQVVNSTLLNENLKKDIDTDRCEGKINVYGSGGVWYWKDGVFYEHDTVVCDDSSFAPLGDHMRWNVSSGLGICDFFGIDTRVFAQTLHQFQGLEHRLEFVGRYRGIDRYNDSFATTTDSVAAAITTLGADLETIFVGGYDNGTEVDILIEAIQQSKLKNIILFPTTGERLRGLLGEGRFSFFETNSMQEGLLWAVEATSPGKSAVLSCGFPSFTMRDNYIHRGNDFKEQVRNLGG